MEDDLIAARKGLRLQSMDDSSVFKRRSSSLRSNSTSSRRSHTPQARPTYLSSSSSSNRRSFFSRSTSRGHKNNASPMTSSPSPTGKDQTLADLFGDVEGLTSPPPPMITKSRSKRDKKNSGSVAFRKSKSTRDTAGSMGRSISRRSSTPIVFSQSTPPKKPPAVEKMLECTLEELCHGGVKNIKITRDVITDEGFVSLFLISFSLREFEFRARFGLT